MFFFQTQLTKFVNNQTLWTQPCGSTLSISMVSFCFCFISLWRTIIRDTSLNKQLFGSSTHIVYLELQRKCIFYKLQIVLQVFILVLQENAKTLIVPIEIHRQSLTRRGWKLRKIHEVWKGSSLHYYRDMPEYYNHQDKSNYYDVTQLPREGEIQGVEWEGFSPSVCLSLSFFSLSLSHSLSFLLPSLSLSLSLTHTHTHTHL